MSNFVERFKGLIESNNISLNSLSKELNISSSQLSKYASKHYEPTLKNSIIICNYFKCSLDYLFGLDNIPNRFGKFYKEDVNKFIKRLNDLIKSRNTNINRICKNIYINRNNFYNWQNAKIFAKVGILAKLSTELNTYMEYLIGRIDIMEKDYEL